MADRKELKKDLRKAKYQVYTKLNSVSRSGMTRHIEVILILDNKPYNITASVAELLDYSLDKNGEGLIVGGCGMDMGFEVVYNLGRALYPKGFKVDGVGRNGDTSGWDNDGGYRLIQHWL